MCTTDDQIFSCYSSRQGQAGRRGSAAQVLAVPRYSTVQPVRDRMRHINYLSAPRDTLLTCAPPPTCHRPQPNLVRARTCPSARYCVSTLFLFHVHALSAHALCMHYPCIVHAIFTVLQLGLLVTMATFVVELMFCLMRQRDP
eukprot:SAG31_NODE_21801_length_540_cov_1.392290_1_plen_143_part_00